MPSCLEIRAAMENDAALQGEFYAGALGAKQALRSVVF